MNFIIKTIVWGFFWIILISITEHFLGTLSSDQWNAFYFGAFGMIILEAISNIIFQDKN